MQSETVASQRPMKFSEVPSRSAGRRKRRLERSVEMWPHSDRGSSRKVNEGSVCAPVWKPAFPSDCGCNVEMWPHSDQDSSR